MNPNLRGRRVLAHDKYLLSLQRELHKLYDIQRSAPLIELDEPYQRGWVRYFRLRYDALRRKDAPALKEILKKVNNYQYCRTGRFVQRHGTSKKEYPIGHHPLRFSVGVLKARQTTEWFATYAKYFEIRLVQEATWNGKILNVQRLVFRFPYYCVSVIEKHLVTHRRACMPEIAARIREIENHLEYGLGRVRLDWLHGIRRHNWRAWQSHSRQGDEHQALQYELEELQYGND